MIENLARALHVSNVTFYTLLFGTLIIGSLLLGFCPEPRPPLLDEKAPRGMGPTFLFPSRISAHSFALDCRSLSRLGITSPPCAV